MVLKRNIGSKLDGQLISRDFVSIDRLAAGEDGIWRVISEGRHTRPQNANQNNASAVYAHTSINGKSTDWVTVHTDPTGQPHDETHDCFDRKPSFSNGSDPLTYIINNSGKSEFKAASLYDTQPREPLKVRYDPPDPSSRTHTILHDIRRRCADSDSDHLFIAVMRPIVIEDRDTEIEDPEGPWETSMYPGVRYLTLDRRAEGNATADAYYLQLTELIAHDADQEPPRPAISEATDWSTSRHNFKWEFVSTNSAVKKMRRAQTDIRHSRLRWPTPVDHKKRAIAVSKPDLRHFTTLSID